MRILQMKPTILSLLAGAAVLSLLQLPAAIAADENDALQVKNAKISLADAVAAAETKTGGRASKAEFEKSSEGWIYDVEVVAGNVVQDVHVNAETAAVISVAADKTDNDDEADAAD
jgi:hypothetical protein